MPSSTTTQIPKWNIKTDYVKTCSCDYGCPCNFNGFPTCGFCRAGLEVMAIPSLTVLILLLRWPKAIHEGNGTAQLFVTVNQIP